MVPKRPPRGPSGSRSPESGLPGLGRRRAALQRPGVQWACLAAHKYLSINTAQLFPGKQAELQQSPGLAPEEPAPRAGAPRPHLHPHLPAVPPQGAGRGLPPHCGPAPVPRCCRVRLGRASLLMARRSLQLHDCPQASETRAGQESRPPASLLRGHQGPWVLSAAPGRQASAGAAPELLLLCAAAAETGAVGG